MALSKPTFFTHLKTLTPHHHHTPPSPTFRHLRLLSFATPEEAAADRRRRKRRLRIEPPLHSLRPQSPRSQPPNPNPIPKPNSPKLPEPATVLTGPRLTLHNRILTLIRANDLDEATLLTRHSIYSNCRPTIFTINAVLTALLRQSRFSDLLSLHRFITQAAVAPNLITHNLILSTYSECRKTDTALEHYKQLINDAPFNPSKATYRILIKGLVDNDKLERALELKNEMLERGFDPDPVVYSYLMMGCVKNSNSDGVFEVFDELKEKLGGFVSDGVVYGGLMKGYFLKGMEKEAMECYEEAVGENSKVKMSAIAFNSVLDALSKNGKFDEALRLFDRMKVEHDPPKRITVNLGSYNVIVDGYFAEGRFNDAIEVFRKMGEKRCDADVLSYNNLIEHLCGNGMLVEAEEIFKEMGEKRVNPDEFTYGLLMDACFKDDRADDAAGYFRRMFESGLRPNLAVYNRLVDGLVKVGKVDEAKGFFDTMLPKLKMDNACYEFIMNALFEEGKVDDVLKIVANMLRDDGIELTEETREVVKVGLRKVDREEDLDKVVEEWEREKAEALAKEAEAAEKAKASAKAAVSSLIPSRLFGNKETEANGEVESGKEESVEEVIASEKEVSESVVEPAEFVEVKSEGTSEQVTA